MLALAATSFCQPGTLDERFGDKGIVMDASHTGTGRAVVIQPDNKIVVGGEGGYNNTIYGFLIYRYLPDGTPDTNFGDKGSTLIDGAAQAYRCVLQDDGKILVSGMDFDDEVDITLIRLNTDGSLDQEFGDNGTTFIDVGRDDYPEGLTVQPDGKILLSGLTFHLNDNDTVFAVRCNSDGSIDQSFANKGVFQFTLGRNDGLDGGQHAVDKDGNMYLGAIKDFTSDAIVLKLDKNGKLDSSFGINGRADYPGALQLTNMGLQSDGKIILSGTTLSSFSAVRMNSDGSIDTEFGEDGHARADFGSSSLGLALAIQKNDEITLGGLVWEEDIYPGLAKFKANGLKDSVFGANGSSVTHLDHSSAIYGLTIQEDGKIVSAGYSYVGGLNPNIPLLARYENSNGKAHFYVRIKRWLHRHGFTWEDCPSQLCNDLNYYAIERSADNGAFSEVARIYRTANQQLYSYQDPAPLNGTANYRLAAVSRDGSTAYSNILEIEDDNTIKIFPNPASNSLKIEGLSNTKKTKLTILDFMGMTKASVTTTGSSYNWNISNLKPGNYLLRIETAGSPVIAKKFAKE